MNDKVVAFKHATAEDEKEDDKEQNDGCLGGIQERMHGEGTRAKRVLRSAASFAAMCTMTRQVRMDCHIHTVKGARKNFSIRARRIGRAVYLNYSSPSRVKCVCS